jgi:hypothetical protein
MIDRINSNIKQIMNNQTASKPSDRRSKAGQQFDLLKIYSKIDSKTINKLSTNFYHNPFNQILKSNVLNGHRLKEQNQQVSFDKPKLSRSRSVEFYRSISIESTQTLRSDLNDQIQSFILLSKFNWIYCRIIECFL